MSKYLITLYVIKGKYDGVLSCHTTESLAEKELARLKDSGTYFPGDDGLEICCVEAKFKV